MINLNEYLINKQTKTTQEFSNLDEFIEYLENNNINCIEKVDNHRVYHFFVYKDKYKESSRLQPWGNNKYIIYPAIECSGADKQWYKNEMYADNRLILKSGEMLFDFDYKKSSTTVGSMKEIKLSKANADKIIEMINKGIKDEGFE